MNYLDFVVTIVKAEIKLTKEQMKFAYLMFYKNLVTITLSEHGT